MSHGTADKKVRCIIVTPERTVLDVTADFVAIPAYDGEVGVLPGRAPLVARLGSGELRLRTGSTTERYFVDGGFGQVLKNVVTILTPRAKPVTDLNSEQLGQQLAELNSEVPTTEEAFASKETRMVRTRAQLRLAKS